LSDMQIRNIGLDGIAILPSRMRSLRPEIVDALAESFRVIGQQQPIIVRPREGAGVALIAGRHRVEAARKLGWPAIQAVVVSDLDADKALLAEIDENLVRGELTPAERSAHHTERARLHEKINGPAKANSAKAMNKVLGRGDVTRESRDTYTEEAAKKTGQHPATVRKDVQRGKSVPDILAVVNTSLDKGEELDALGKLHKADPAAATALIERAKAGEKVSAKTEVKKVERREKERDLGKKQIALPNKRYGVIVADPEWKFKAWSEETGMDRAADNHYPTSATDMIAARDVQSIAADDCVLFLWATVPMLPDALRVMDAWGFQYKSHCMWSKDRAGTGYWFRNMHELLLVGTRGKVPAPAPGTQWASVIEAEVTGHSAKPEEFLRMIEQYFPTLPKIELNRRGAARLGWDAWGNEAVAA
jgi:ParB/RepB/Spo0J family partition protein